MSRLPPLLRNRLSAPVIGAPMFLVSFPPLVLALCKAGVVGAFPHVNARSSDILDGWLSEMTAELRAFAAAHPGRPVGPPVMSAAAAWWPPRRTPTATSRATIMTPSIA